MRGAADAAPFCIFLLESTHNSPTNRHNLQGPSCYNTETKLLLLPMRSHRSFGFTSQTERMDVYLRYEDFVELMQEKMREKLGEDVQVALHRVTKNNSVILDGMVIRRQDVNLAPTVYLEELYREYEDGKTIPELVDYVSSLCQDCMLAEKFDPELYKDFARAKSHLACKLVSRSRNCSMLEQVPYEAYLDLALVPYYRVEDEALGKGMILVQRTHCEAWKVSEQHVIDCARENMKEMLPMTFVTMRQMLEKCGCDMPDDTPMYILTNREGCMGAAEMIYDSVLQEIGEELGSDFWILPSSIHECIILPKNTEMTVEELTELVQEVNRTEVSEEDFLSDHVYEYEVLGHRLRIAG